MLFFFITLAAASPAGAGTPAAATLLAVEPLEGKAVIRLGEELLLVTEGDELTAANLSAAEGRRFRITDVLPDRLVLEETAAERGVAPRDPRRAWLFKPQKPGGASRVRVLEPRPPSFAPVRQPARPQSFPEPPDDVGVKAVRCPAPESGGRKED